jgi:GT2 family glycosyltransferase
VHAWRRRAGIRGFRGDIVMTTEGSREFKPHEQPLDTPTLSILIINWNRAQDTSALLQDIIEQSSTLTSFEVLLLDNGSEEPLPSWWSDCARIRLTRSSVNLGYSGGMRLLLEQSRSKVCWLLNNDCRIGPGILKAAVDTAGNMTEALIMPLVLNPDGSMQSRDCYWHPILGWRVGPEPSPKVPNRRIFGDIFVAPLIARQEAIRLGLFPPQFHTYGEDFDASYALAAAGLVVRRCAGLVVHHRKSSSKPAALDERYRFEVQGVRNVLASAVINQRTINSVWTTLPLFLKYWMVDLFWKRRKVLYANPRLLRLWASLPVSSMLLARDLRDLRARRKKWRASGDARVWTLQ